MGKISQYLSTWTGKTVYYPSSKTDLNEHWKITNTWWVRSKLLRAVTLKMIIFWDVTSCVLPNYTRHTPENSNLHEIWGSYQGVYTKIWGSLGGQNWIVVFRPFRLSHGSVWQMVTDVSEEHAASILCSFVKISTANPSATCVTTYQHYVVSERRTRHSKNSVSYVTHLLRA
jgi:hypothetical protein